MKSLHRRARTRAPQTRAGSRAILAGCAIAVISALGGVQASGVVAEGHRVSTVDGDLMLADDGAFEPGWYVGLGLGSSDLDPDGGTSGWSVSDGSDSATRLEVGRHFKPRWRAGFAVTNLGAAGLSNSNPAIDAAIPNAKIDYSAIGLHVDWLARPVNTPFNGFARVGLTSIDNDVSDSAISYSRGDDVSLSFGGGVQWRGDGRWLASLTYEHMADDVQWVGLTLGAYLGKPVALTQKIRELSGKADAGWSQDPDDATANNNSSASECRVVKRAVPGVDFASGSANLDESSMTLLVQVADALARAPDILVEVVGHTDSQGDAGYNQGLSAQRAKAVRDFLTSQPGVLTQISWRGAGEMEPLADNNTADGRRQNRRIELVFDNRLVCN